MTHRCATKEDTIAINRDLVYNLLYIQYFLPLLHLRLITERMLSKQFFLIYKHNHLKILTPICHVAEEFLNQYCFEQSTLSVCGKI